MLGVSVRRELEPNKSQILFLKCPKSFESRSVPMVPVKILELPIRLTGPEKNLYRGLLVHIMTQGLLKLKKDRWDTPKL